MNRPFTILLLLAFCATFTFAQNAAPKDIIKKNDIKQSSVNATSTTNVATYDFTTGADKFYGGTSGAKELESGVWGMIAGDANGDGGIYAEDYTAYQTNQGNEDYNVADFNLDGGVYAEDYTLYQLNQGKETSVPQ